MNAIWPILKSDKIYFIARNITRDKNRHYIMLKGSIHQKDIVFLSPSKYILIKEIPNI